jgi:predicted RNase H-like nuclease (RuvC/YqgF family)
MLTDQDEEFEQERIGWERVKLSLEGEIEGLKTLLVDSERGGGVGKGLEALMNKLGEMRERERGIEEVKREREEDKKKFEKELEEKRGIVDELEKRIEAYATNQPVEINGTSSLSLSRGHSVSRTDSF